MKKLWGIGVSTSCCSSVANSKNIKLTFNKPVWSTSELVGHVIDKKDYESLVKNLNLLEICISTSNFYKGSADERFLNKLRKVIEKND